MARCFFLCERKGVFMEIDNKKIGSSLSELLRVLLESSVFEQAFSLAVVMIKEGYLQAMEVLALTDKLQSNNKKDYAEKIYELWLFNGEKSLDYVAYFNYAILLVDLGKLERAEFSYRRAIASNPVFVQAYLNLGTLLERLGRKEEALSCWGYIASSFSPEKIGETHYLHAINNIGRLQEGMGKYDEAELTLTRSLRINGDQPDVVQHWVHLRQKQCKWPVYEPLEKVSSEYMLRFTSPLAMLSASDEPSDQLNAANTFVARKVDTTLPRLSPQNGYGHNKIRIGYLSSDFCLHPVSLLTVQLYELHNREKFEVYGFSWSREDGSTLRRRVVEGMDYYIPIGSMTDGEAAQTIKNHEIDILIDLQGLTSGARPNILCYKPAPLQVSYLGYPGTTGLPCNDYVIADKYVLPEELVPYFSEKPIYLPNSFQISDRQREEAECPSRLECGLPEDKFVFCSFNNNFKFRSDYFSAWMRILKAVDNSVLWLLADNQWAKQNMLKHAEKFGVDSSRLIFAPRVAPPQYLARYQVADLFLDTSPFNAGTTANDALWMGLPILTCPGKTFSSRMAGSLLHTIGVEELICADLVEYESRAIDLAINQEKLFECKRKIKQARNHSVLFDSERFVVDYENALLGAYVRDVC